MLRLPAEVDCALLARVQVVLVWVWSEVDRIAFVLKLVLDVALDELLREDVATEQELVVVRQRGEGCSEGAWSLFDAGLFERWQFVQVLVDWLRWLNLVHDSVEASHQ